MVAKLLNSDSGILSFRYSSNSNQDLKENAQNASYVYDRNGRPEIELRNFKKKTKTFQ